VNFLAVDATGESLLLAVGDEKGSWTSNRASRAHDERLWPRLEALLRRSGLRLSDIDAVAASSGPGRFTGVRIGMTFAAMLARSLGRPALAISRFEVEAAKARQSAEAFAVVLPAGRQGAPESEFYIQVFGANGRPSAKPAWAPSARLAGHLKGISALAGPAAPAAAELLAREGEGVPSILRCPSAPGAALLQAAARQWSDRRRAPFKPLYVKPAKFEMPRSER